MDGWWDSVPGAAFSRLEEARDVECTAEWGSLATGIGQMQGGHGGHLPGCWSGDGLPSRKASALVMLAHACGSLSKVCFGKVQAALAGPMEVEHSPKAHRQT